MELRQYLSVIGRWWWLVVLSVLIAAISSYLASNLVTPLYRTTTTLIVGRTTQNPDPNSNDLYVGQQLAFTYMQLAMREPVLKGAIASLGMDMPWQALAANVNATSSSQLLEISVIDNDPERAKALADAIAHQLILQSPSGAQGPDQEQISFIQAQLKDLKSKIETAQNDIERYKQELDTANSARQIQDLNEQISILDTKISGWQDTYSKLIVNLQGGEVNALNVLEEASIPWEPISPNKKMNVLLASIVGLILAVAGIFVIEYLDDTIKTPDDITRTLNLPTLGNIDNIEGGETVDKLIAARQPLSPMVEAFRVLRMNLMFSSLDKPVRTLVVTSPNPVEGKSVTLSNLAVVMAQIGQKVIIVDTDLRRPSIHRVFGLQNRVGLSDAILNPNTSAKDCLQESGIENLRILTSGLLPPSPSEVLGSTRMLKLIEQLKEEADILLFDTPPSSVFTDPIVLAAHVDGAILVNRSGYTRTGDARKVVDQFRRLGVNILGVVITRQNVNRRKTYSYYTYYRNEPGAGNNNGHKTWWPFKSKREKHKRRAPTIPSINTMPGETEIISSPESTVEISTPENN